MRPVDWRALAPFWAALLLLSLLSACGGPSQQAIRVDGDLQAVYKAASRHVQKAPADARALAQLGAVEHRLNKHREAVRHLSRAAGLAPNDAEIARWRGEALLGARRPVEALRAFRRAASLDEDWADTFRDEVAPRVLSALAALAAAGERLGAVIKAADTLDPALLRAHPSEAAAFLVAKGDLRFEAGNHHDAIAAYKKALATGASAEVVPFKLGQAYTVLRQLDRADRQFRTWVEGAKGNTRTARLIEVADLLQARFAFDAARRYYEEALAIHPGDRRIRRALGQVLLKGRHFPEARKVLMGLLDGDPTGSAPAGSHSAGSHPILSGYDDVARLFLKYRRVDAAIAVWKRALTLQPTDVERWKLLAHVLDDRGRLSELEALVGHPDAHASWAAVYMDLRRFKRAATRIEAALKAKGAAPKLWLRLAVARHRLKQPAARDQALARYRKVTERRPEAAALLAATYEKMGDSARAEKTWRLVLEGAPQDRRAAFAVVRLRQSAKDKSGAAAVLKQWALAQAAGAPRAKAWLEVTKYWFGRRAASSSSRAAAQCLAQGQTPSRREALMLGARIQLDLLQNVPRAEELFQAWIEASRPDAKHEARRKVVALLASKRQMRRFRSRLLEDMAASRPGDARTFLALAESYATARPSQPGEAFRAIERFVNLSADRRAAILAGGKLLLRHGAVPQAARIYAKLAPDEIEDPALHLELGRLFANGQVNDKTRARLHLRRYLESGATSARTDGARLMRLAGRLLRRGLPDISVAIYRRLLSQSKNKSRYLRPLGDALLVLGQVEQADEAFRSYLEAMGNNPAAVRQVAETFYRKRFYRRAQAFYETIFTARRRRQLPRTFPRLAQTYRLLGDTSGLESLAHRFVTFAPNARNYAAAAHQLQQAGLYRKALEYYGNAAERMPGAPEFRQRQAELALRLGDVEEAAGYLQRMITAQRATPKAWVAAGRILEDNGQDERALALYGAALAQDNAQGMGAIHLARARVYLRVGRLDDAHADFVRALTHMGNLDEVLAQVRESYLGAGEHARYVDILRRAAALNPARAATWLALGDMALRAGALDEARQHFDRYVEREPKGLLTVGAKLWQVGAIRAAAHYYRRAATAPLLEGREKAMADVLAALAALGSPEAVPEAISKFLVASQNPRDNMLALAQVLDQAGYVESAIAYFSRVLNGSAAGDGQLRLGRLWLRVGQVDKAREALSRHIEAASPPGPRVFVGRGGPTIPDRAVRILEVARVYEAAGQDAEALRVLADGARRHPEVGTIHVQRARLLFAQGKLLPAIDALAGLVTTRSVDQLPAEEADALVQLLRYLGREREALDVLQRTAPGTRSNALAFAISRLALQVGHTAQAQAEISRVLALDPHGALRLQAGMAFFEAGRYLEAAQYLLEALEPGRGAGAVEEATTTLLVLTRLTHDPGLLLDVTARLERMFEDRSKFHSLMARALMEAGYFAEAAEHAARWVEHVADRPDGDKLLIAGRPHAWRALVRARLMRGDDAGALSAARDFVEKAKRPREARRQMARLMTSEMAFGPALTLFEAAIEADRSDRSSRLSAGMVALELGQLARGQRHLDAYLDPPSAEARLKVARVYAAAGLTDRAEAVYAEGEPDVVRNELARPLMWLRAGDVAKAREALAAAERVAADPNLLKVEVLASYLRSPEIPDAWALELADAVLAVSAEPHPVAQLARACALVAQGQAAEAKTLVEAVLARGGVEDLVFHRGARGVLGPVVARQRALQLFALKALGAGRLSTARWALERLTRRGARGRLRAIDVLAQAFELPRVWRADERQRLVKMAMEWLGPLRSRPQLVLGAVDRIASLYEQSGDVEAAIWTYREALRRFPERAYLHNNLAYLLARRGIHLDEALRLVRRAEQLSPAGSLAYLDTEGWVLHQLGRNEEAVTRIEASMRLMTLDDADALAESLFHLGSVYQALGRLDEARKAFRRSVRTNPISISGRRSAKALKAL